MVCRRTIGEMTMLHLCVLSAVILAGAARTPAIPPQAAADIVVIDGKKDPSQLPEWLVWQQGFTILAGWRGKDSGFNHELREALSKEEFDVLEREALAQGHRTEQATKEAEPLRALYDTRDPNDQQLAATLDEKMYEVNLKYRRAILEARNRVLEALRPESQSVLLSWIGDIRTDIVSRVPKGELARWRAPE
jgi:hypothetical protein